MSKLLLMILAAGAVVADGAEPQEHGTTPAQVNNAAGSSGSTKGIEAEPGNHSCVAYCGSRGSMNAEWPASGGRPIRYMNILLNSQQYKSAVAEYERTTGAGAAPSGGPAKAR